MPQQPQQGAGPQSFVGALEGMPIERLLQEFNNPASQFPKYAVLSAMQKQQEQQRLEQAAQGQAAIQQNAMAGPPVAQGILAGAQQMAMQDAMQNDMQSYNTGGIVAFNPGGPTVGFGGQDYEDARRFGIDLSPYDSAEQRAAKLDRLREMRTLSQRDTPSKDQQTLSPYDMQREIKLLSSRAPAPGGIAGLSRAAGGAKAPSMDPNDPGRGTPGFKESMDELRAAKEAYGEQLKKSADVTEEEKGIRQAIIDQMRTASEAKKQFIESASDRAKQDYERRLGAATRPIHEDPESLLALVGGLSTKRGEVFKSLGAGAAAQIGAKRKSREEAEKMYGEAQDKLETLKDAQRNLAISIDQQRLAYASGDRKAINEANEKVAQAQIAFIEAKTKFGQKEEEIKSDRIKAQAAARAAAAKEGASFGNIREQQLYLKSLRDQARSLEQELKSYPLPTKERKAEISAELKQVNAQMSMLTKSLAESLGMPVETASQTTGGANPVIDFTKI